MNGHRILRQLAVMITVLILVLAGIQAMAAGASKYASGTTSAAVTFGPGVGTTTVKSIYATTDKEGGVVAVPKSISFASMDDDEFERLYSDVLTFICQTWVLDESQINQIVEFM